MRRGSGKRGGRNYGAMEPAIAPSSAAGERTDPFRSRPYLLCLPC
ncbi:hypothetical protein D779_0195 [Imhoffiella purpurea]|uniref:Uncharacterized protein n=1 Tax=Imhoffiella purpurea TaxID=1249627 RepID=W9VA38_9GAMM|nr:hypothetical protein D779_0195 [Imhoffiella purpurea]